MNFCVSHRQFLAPLIIISHDFYTSQCKCPTANALVCSIQLWERNWVVCLLVYPFSKIIHPYSLANNYQYFYASLSSVVVYGTSFAYHQIRKASKNSAVLPRSSACISSYSSLVGYQLSVCLHQSTEHRHLQFLAK